MANNEVRIIGGQWRGRKLTFPARAHLRPTLGRVRETLYNWLAPSIHGARCLDLYAGSGALGFEALSRGAAEVIFVERDRKTAMALRRNAEMLGARATVVTQPAARYLASAPAPFDLILFDPPFADEDAYALLPELLDRFLTESGLLYLETSKHRSLPLPDRILKESTAGDCRFALYGR
jgi:16S rRNA (guanine966-N2)-methyltransferase